MALLSVQNLQVAYGDLIAVNDVSFSVGRNEVFVLLGANGAGKSSILRCVSGLAEARSGAVLFEGKSIGGLRPYEIARLGVSHVPEGRRIFSYQSVRENLTVSFIRRGADTFQHALERVYALFPRLKEREKQIAGTMSGGEQQMVAIGRAMMNNPAVLMLDEPSLGLSPLMTEQVFERLEVISAEGTSLLLVEQNAASLDLATKGLVLANGRAVYSGETDSFKSSDFVKRAYIGM